MGKKIRRVDGRESGNRGRRKSWWENCLNMCGGEEGSGNQLEKGRREGRRDQRGRMFTKK